MKKGYLRGFILILFSYFMLNLIFFQFIYGVVEIKDSIIYPENVDISSLTRNIVNEVIELPNNEILTYSFEIDFDSDSNKKEIVSNLQKDIIERLDGILTITPAVQTVITGDLVSMTIKPYYLENNDYDVILDNLIKEAKTKKTDTEKIYVLANYMYQNNFKYAYDDNIEFPNIGTSKIIENKNCMPDGVLLRKKGICEGYANLMTDFCTKLDIPCIKLRGYNQEGGYHAWNMLFIENDNSFAWYCVQPLVSMHKLNNPRLIQVPNIYKENEKMSWDENLEKDIINIKYTDLDLEIIKNRNCFKDIDNSWAKYDIIKLYLKGMVSGYSDNTFRPNSNITIAEFLKIVLKPYMDDSNVLIENTWWESSYYYALDNGIITEELFPKESLFENITREEMAYIFVRIDEILNNSDKIEVPMDFSIIDESEISECFKESVYQCYLKGFMTGIDLECTFSPKSNATRAQVAVILNRM